jgi:pimeloyl-ACP methyl ester carboxylesterase
MDQHVEDLRLHVRDGALSTELAPIAVDLTILERERHPLAPGDSGSSPAILARFFRTAAASPGIIEVVLPHMQPSRRDVLRAAGCGAGLVTTNGLAFLAQTMNMKTFVLVHPAWHGGWCWKKVVPFLREKGQVVATPTLTGLGERSHLASPEVGLETHVIDVVNVLKEEDLRDVVLVGHSSSGAVITGVADRAPERLAQVIYLDAFVPDDGEAVLDLVTPDRRRALEQLVKSEGQGWLLPRFAPAPWETIVREMWGVTDTEDVRWMLERLRPTPVGHFRDPVRRTNPAAEKLPRTYVRCRQFPNPRFDNHAEMARRTAGWRYRELAASHHPAITTPDRVAGLLLELAF